MITTTIRVRYAETDQMGVAYYANHFVWFEVARGAFCRARGIDYIAMEADGLYLPIMEAKCRYKTPARYDDELTVAVHVSRLTKRTVHFNYTVMRDGTLIAEGETTQMLVDAKGTPRAFPDDIAARFDSEQAC